MSEKKPPTAEELIRLSRFVPRYSGAASEAFWSTISKSKNRTLYTLGVVLQELEQRVLTDVNEDMGVQIREHLRKQRQRRKS